MSRRAIEVVRDLCPELDELALFMIGAHLWFDHGMWVGAALAWLMVFSSGTRLLLYLVSLRWSR